MSLLPAPLPSPQPSFEPQRCAAHPEQLSTRSCPRCGRTACERCPGGCEACVVRDALAGVVRVRAHRAARYLRVCGVLAVGFALQEGWDALHPEASEDVGFVAVTYLLFYMAVMFGTMVAFLRWLHGAMRLAPLLGAPPSEGEYSPRASVLWWFVPIAHYFIPYRIVRELHARLGTQEPGAAQGSTETQLQLWWGFWLVSSWVNNVSMRMGMREAPGAGWVSAAGELLSVPAAFLAARLVLEIQSRGEQRLRELGPRP